MSIVLNYECGAASIALRFLRPIDEVSLSLMERDLWLVFLFYLRLTLRGFDLNFEGFYSFDDWSTSVSSSGFKYYFLFLLQAGSCTSAGLTGPNNFFFLFSLSNIS